MLIEPQFPEYVDFRNTPGIVLDFFRSRCSALVTVHSLLACQCTQSGLHQFAGIRITATFDSGTEEFIQLWR